MIACAWWALPLTIAGWFLVALLVGGAIGAAASLGKTDPEDLP